MTTRGFPYTGRSGRKGRDKIASMYRRCGICRRSLAGLDRRFLIFGQVKTYCSQDCVNVAILRRED